MKQAEGGGYAVDAWLGAIARAGWAEADIDDAAAASGLSAHDILREAGDRTDALSAFLSRVAQETALGAATAGTTRERLFDGLMRGFDTLQAHRAAVLAIWQSRDPGVMALVLGQSGASLRRLAGAAGVPTAGVRGQLRQAVLGIVCARAFATWREDASADMAATMAELDSLLARAERAETDGFSPDLLGLPGLGSLADRLPWSRGRDRDETPAPDDPALRPLPDPARVRGR